MIGIPDYPGFSPIIWQPAKPTNYSIICCDLDTIAYAMRTMLDKGWHPLGGVTFDPETGNPVQTLVRYD